MTEPDFCSPQHEAGCLEGLPLSIPRYQYQGRHRFWRMLDLELGRHDRETDCILFHIDSIELDHDFLDENTTYFPKSRFCFDIAHELLLVKMPRPEHGVAGDSLWDQLRLELLSMGHGLSDAILSTSGASVREDGTGKCADKAFGPRRRARSDQANAVKTYTVTVEVGISETATNLKRDVDYWLNPDCGNVNMVITIKARRQVTEINIQTWRMINERPHCEQSIWISKNTTGNVNVTDPLNIPFSALFDREQTIPAERDIVLSKERLQSIAEDIWQIQGI